MSKNNVALVVSALGVLMTIISELVALVRQLGGRDEDIHRLATPEGRLTLEAMARLIVGAGRKACSSVCLVVSTALDLPSCAMNVIHKEDHEAFFAGQNVELELIEFLGSSESHVVGEEMFKRSLINTHPAGNRTFEYLASHPEIIPHEWQKFTLLFPGTVLIDVDGSRFFQSTRFFDGQWLKNNRRLCGVFDSRCRVVGFRNK